MGNNVKVNVEQIDKSSSKGDVRSHSVIIDRPEAKGGTDQGAMGGELLLISLGGCFMSNLLEIVRTRNADISNLKATVIGTLDGTPGRFTEINMQISGATLDLEQLTKFVSMAERACLVANTLKQSIPVNISVS